MLIAAIVAAISLISYYSLRQQNLYTGEVQHISVDVDQERRRPTRWEFA